VTRAHQYRVKAEECREQAERARVPDVREQWLRLASQWERLAKEAERQSGQSAEQPDVIPPNRLEAQKKPPRRDPGGVSRSGKPEGKSVPDAHPAPAESARQASEASPLLIRAGRVAEHHESLMASTTNDNMEDEIRRRAYELWEQYGRPDGGEEEFWLKAEREIKQAKGLDRVVPEPSKTASDPQEQTSARKK
jgi:hypothetical protein